MEAEPDLNEWPEYLTVFFPIVETNNSRICAIPEHLPEHIVVHILRLVEVLSQIDYKFNVGFLG